MGLRITVIIKRAIKIEICLYDQINFNSKKTFLHFSQNPIFKVKLSQQAPSPPKGYLLILQIHSVNINCLFLFPNKYCNTQLWGKKNLEILLIFVIAAPEFNRNMIQERKHLFQIKKELLEG